MDSRCAECDQFMEWPIQCRACHGWFCQSCSSATDHYPCQDDICAPDDDDPWTDRGEQK